MKNDTTRISVVLDHAGATVDDQLRAAGLEPDAYEVTREVSVKERASKPGRYVYSLDVREKPLEQSLPALYAVARKQHVQATCLDSGSSWWTNSGGQGDSDAGLTILEVTRDRGFSVGSVDVLYGRDVELKAAA